MRVTRAGGAIVSVVEHTSRVGPGHTEVLDAGYDRWPGESRYVSARGAESLGEGPCWISPAPTP